MNCISVLPTSFCNFTYIESFPLPFISPFEIFREMVDDVDVDAPEKAEDNTSVEKNMLDP